MKKQKWCKILESEKYGDILVVADTSEDGYPSVSVKMVPEGLGICGPNYEFTDEDENKAWEKVDKLFSRIDIEKAESIAKELHEMTRGIPIYEEE
jgi:hypothetical protein